MAGHPCKRYVFTINNPSEEDYNAVKEFITPENCLYAIVGEEEVSTLHLQGFVNLKKRMRFNPFKAAIGGRAHVEQAKGTDLDNKRYCSKQKVYLEIGEPSAQGKRSDLKEAVALLNSGSSMTELAQAYPSVYIRYGRGLKDYVITAQLVKVRDFKTDVHVITGIPGCGKSKFCSERTGDKYWKPRGKWWDGYTGQEIVILDDFYGWLPFDELLRICDRYPCRVETKGGTMEFVSKSIYITSNKPVEEWYGEECCLEALFRRITSYKIMRKGEGMSDKIPTLFPINC